MTENPKTHDTFGGQQLFGESTNDLSIYCVVCGSIVFLEMQEECMIYYNGKESYFGCHNCIYELDLLRERIQKKAELQDKLNKRKNIKRKK